MNLLRKYIAILVAAATIAGSVAGAAYADDAPELPGEDLITVETADEVSDSVEGELPELVLAEEPDEEPDEDITSGSCGTDLTWNLDGGVLTISGSGAMADYSSEDPAPWEAHASEITEIHIDKDVTSIGDNAFSALTGIGDVYFGGTSSEWADVNKGSGNDILDSCNIHCNDVLDGWVEKDGEKYYYVNNSPVTGWYMIEGDYYLFGSDGVMKTGWQTSGGNRYYLLESGKMIKGLQTIDGRKYFFKDSGALATGWVLLSEGWYYSGSDGVLTTGWQNVNGKRYYFNNSGLMQTGWQKVNGAWYYLSGSGAMVTGWLKDNNKWYYLRSSGAMATGWEKVNGKWYYFRNGGSMATGWFKDNNKWYYLRSSGAMLTGWFKDNNKWYYLKSSGAMATGWEKVNGKWYYFRNGGSMATGWVKDGNLWYYLRDSGEMVTGWQRINGTQYYFTGSGAWRDKNAVVAKANSYSSSTKYLILVDCGANAFSVLEGSKGNWKVKYDWPCSTGAGSTKTPKGVFQIGGKTYSFSGPDSINPLTYSNPLCYTVYYASYYASGGYWIHSTLYRYGSWDVMDDRLGLDLSHGCIRLNTDNAKWIYNNVPAGTTVVTY